MPRVLKASADAIGEAAAALRADRIVAVPTSRWFMVCCRAAARTSIEHVFRAKSRVLSKQALFVLPSKDRVAEYFKVGRGAQRLVDRLWPGELTLHLRWRDPGIAAEFSGVDKTAALVYSPPGLLGDVAAAASLPLAATTVNLSDATEPSSPGPAISVEEVLLFIQKAELKVDLVIDMGICPAFMPTTIVDCRSVDVAPSIVRQGYVHERAIRAALSSSMEV